MKSIEANVVNNNWIEVVIKDRISEADIQEVYKTIKNADSNNKAVLVRIEKLDGFQEKEAWLAKAKAELKLINHIDKIAVVTNEDWVKTMLQIGGVMVPQIDVKTFGADAYDDAKQWLLQ